MDSDFRLVCLNRNYAPEQIWLEFAVCTTLAPCKDNLASLLSCQATASDRFLSQVSLWSDLLLHCDVSHPCLHTTTGLHISSYGTASLHRVSTFLFSLWSIKFHNIHCLHGKKAFVSVMLNKLLGEGIWRTGRTSNHHRVPHLRGVGGE
jgi:hypothetical protein